MRQAFSVLWQAVVLLVAALAGFLVGGAVPALRVSRVLSRTATTLRTYDFDWLLAVGLVYVLLLLLLLVRGRLRSGWRLTTLAAVLVVAGLLLLTQLGVKETVL